MSTGILRIGHVVARSLRFCAVLQSLGWTNVLWIMWPTVTGSLGFGCADGWTPWYRVEFTGNHGAIIESLVRLACAAVRVPALVA